MQKEPTTTVVNGCYLDIGGEMYKVKMLDFDNGEIQQVIMEDTLSRLHRISIMEWIKLNLIPMCLSWTADPSYICYDSETTSNAL